MIYCIYTKNGSCSRSKGDDCMKFTIIGKNINVTPGLKAAVEEKIGKLEKYFTPDTIANVTLNVDKERHKIEVTIPVKGKIIRAEQVSNDMYVSIDLVEDSSRNIRANWLISSRLRPAISRRNTSRANTWTKRLFASRG